MFLIKKTSAFSKGLKKPLKIKIITTITTTTTTTTTIIIIENEWDGKMRESEKMGGGCQRRLVGAHRRQ